MKMKNLTLPECEFKISGIPNAGNGVYATQDFQKGKIVGEYGGEVISAREAKRRRASGDDSHIRSVGTDWTTVPNRLQPGPKLPN